MKESLTKKERLGKKSDLNKIFASGNLCKCRGAKILFLKSSLPYSRFAVAAGCDRLGSGDRWLGVRHDQAVAHPYDAVGLTADLFRVGDDDKGTLAVAMGGGVGEEVLGPVEALERLLRDAIPGFPDAVSKPASSME